MALNNKWGTVLDLTLAVAGLAIPIITGKRNEAKQEAELNRKVAEEVAKAMAAKKKRRS